MTKLSFVFNGYLFFFGVLLLLLGFPLLGAFFIFRGLEEIDEEEKDSKRTWMV